MSHIFLRDYNTFALEPACQARGIYQVEFHVDHLVLRFVFLDFNSDYTTLLDRAGLPTLELARKREILVEVYKAVMHLSPRFMWCVFTPKLTSYNLQNSNKLYIPHLNTTKYGLRSFSAYGATLWNSLPGQIKLCGDLKQF